MSCHAWSTFAPSFALFPFADMRSRPLALLLPCLQALDTVLVGPFLGLKYAVLTLLGRIHAYAYNSKYVAPHRLHIATQSEGCQVLHQIIWTELASSGPIDGRSPWKVMQFSPEARKPLSLFLKAWSSSERLTAASPLPETKKRETFTCPSSQDWLIRTV